MAGWARSHVLSSVTFWGHDTLTHVTSTLNKNGLITLSSNIDLNIRAFGAVLVLLTSITTISLALLVGVGAETTAWHS